MLFSLLLFKVLSFSSCSEVAASIEVNHQVPPDCSLTFQSFLFPSYRLLSTPQNVFDIHTLLNRQYFPNAYGKKQTNKQTKRMV